MGAVDAELKTPLPMDRDTAQTIHRILRWWHATHGLVPGSRNANVFKLAAVFNRGNVPFELALDECLALADPTGPDPFTAEEITRTVKSAYRQTDHPVKQWKPRTAGMPQALARRTALSEAQARAVEDALVERFRKAMQAPPIPNTVAEPLPASPPPPEDRVQAFVRRHHLEHFVEAMDLDLDRARIVALTPQGAGDKTAEIVRHGVNAAKGQQDAST